MSQRPSSESLPARPDLEQLKKLAKELRATGKHPSLAEAQHALAKRYGFASWGKLKLAVEQATLKRGIEEDNIDGVRALLEASKVLAKLPFEDGSTPLHLAAGENRAAMVELLVASGASLSSKFGESGHSALSWAVTCWAYDAAQKLVDLGHEPDLFCAAGLGHLDRVRSFWRGDALKPSPSRTGSSRYLNGKRLPCPPPLDRDQVSDALYIACRCDRVRVARWLLEHDADPNWRGYAGATCLAWAEFSGNAELCAMLRAKGGSDDLLDHEFHATPKAFGMMVLAGWSFPKLLVGRLTADPSLARLTGGRGTLLHAAARNGQLISAKILLHFGADPVAPDADGRTPVDVATVAGHTALAELLRGAS